MSDKIQLTIGKILSIKESSYRVIFVSLESSVLCLLNTNRLDLRLFSTNKIFKGLDDKSITMSEEVELIVDEDDLTESELKNFKDKQQIVRRITEEYGPTYIDLCNHQRKPVIDELVAEGNYSRRSINRIILVYLQSGLKDSSLIDQRHWADQRRGKERIYEVQTGRAAGYNSGIAKNAEVVRQFEECLKFYISQKGEKSIREVYEELLLGKYYSQVRYIDDGSGIPIVSREWVDASERPTYRQLTYYFRNHLSPKERDEIKVGREEYRNNLRTFTGSSETGVYNAYDLAEMDAVEFDVSLVNNNGKPLAIGRPIIYLMKDVATRMIIAASIGFNNNSNVGCINCFANLREDKGELCAQYGILGVTSEMWPSGFKPKRLRFDNGSDFISNRVGEICVALNIQRDIVPPATGSMKAVIERSFHDAHDKLNHHFAEHGHIKKNHGSEHHKHASLTIHQFIEMFYAYVITYNTTMNTGISLTPDMVESGVKKIPASIMKYYLNLSLPQTLPYGDEFLRILLVKGIATIERNGINFHKLNYLNLDDAEITTKMQNYKHGPYSLRILYDPRSIDTIYYISDGILTRAHLNLDYKAQRTYVHMTFKEFDDFQEKIKKLDKEAQHYSEEVRSEMYMANTQAVKLGKTNQLADTKHMRENREMAKQLRTREEALDNRIGSKTLQTEPKKEIKDIIANDGSIETAELPYLTLTELSPAEKLKRLAAANFDDDEEE